MAENGQRISGSADQRPIEPISRENNDENKQNLIRFLALPEPPSNIIQVNCNCGQRALIENPFRIAVCSYFEMAPEIVNYQLTGFAGHTGLGTPLSQLSWLSDLCVQTRLGAACIKPLTWNFCSGFSGPVTNAANASLNGKLVTQLPPLPLLLLKLHLPLHHLLLFALLLFLFGHA